MRKLDYDPKYDVVYISLGDMSNSYGDEDPDGIVVHRDMDTDEITGVTVFGFSKRVKNGEILPIVGIDLRRDVLPLIN